MQILDWRQVAANIHEYIRKKITETPIKPHLAVILVGENPASQSYIRMKRRACEAVGMDFSLIEFEENIQESELIDTIKKLNADPNIHGILIQAPLPSHIVYRDIVEVIDPKKDVDGFTRTNIGNLFLGDDSGLVSCTPKWIKKLLDAYNIPFGGKHVVILGRSNIVGKPMSLIAINAGATVTVCNSKTRDLQEITKSADILIVAIGKPGFVTRDMVQPETVVVDVGCTFVNGFARWDVDFETVSEMTHCISPVPGGVGPMTVAMVIENTWNAFELQYTRDNSTKINAVQFKYQWE
jgi:methylenetetrahydrofolate dehydrogenase (NADP+)/methenyltetrahydrofolate cyclohydrolase